MALACTLLAASPAPAFYWSLSVTPTIIPPTDLPGNPPTPGANPLPLPPDTSVPGGGPGNPGSVPEPTSAAAGLIGLGLLAMRRLMRKRRLKS